MASEIIIGIDGVQRPATEAETAEILAVQEKLQQEKIAATQAAEEALEARKAPLRRIGLTDEEINIVLGL